MKISNSKLKQFLMVLTAGILISSSYLTYLALFGRAYGLEWPSSNSEEHLNIILQTELTASILLMVLLSSIYAIQIKTPKLQQPQVSPKITKITQEKIQSTAFLESISHEIRTPLNGIIGYAEYIQHTSHESMIQFPAQIIFESSQHLLRLIDNLLDLTEIETERKKMKKNLFELNASLEDLCKSHLSRSSKKNIALRYEYDAKCPRTVILDESLFRKIISNLLDNAIVFSKDIGEIVLSVHYLKNIHSLYISIKDDGHGIPEKMHAHVFDKFWQIEDFMANAHGGSALGLALTQKMVAMLGGEINFNSSENVGSIFYFTLPLEEN